MPLSEHEQRLLDQMEQQLYDDDPKLAGRLAEDPSRAHTRKRLLIGALVVLLGLGLVVLGVATSQSWPGALSLLVGGLGFIVMVAGVGYAMTPGRVRARLGTVEDDGQVKAHRSDSNSLGGLKKRLGGQSGGTSGSFMQRMEERWERRRREGGGW